MNSSLEEFYKKITVAQRLHVEQVYEGIEVFTGVETRNKYRILDETHFPLAYAVERSGGITGDFMRLIFKHFRRFEIDIFNDKREKLFVCNFPFRWLFKTLSIQDANGKPIGRLEQRWSLFYKRFDIYNEQNRIVARIKSSFLKIWTFEIKMGHKKFGTIQKKWSGLLTEMFTDRDKFTVSFAEPNLDHENKTLMLAMALLVDIVYFENNQQN